MDRAVKIERGVKISPVVRNGRVPVYPFGEMQVGDSIQIEEDKWKSALSCAYTFGKKHKMKFSVRSKERRIWRKA